MDEKYFAKKIEKKWQQIWEENKVFQVEISQEKPKFYALEMLPYPSGNLHMGHVRNYSIGDALAWYKRLKGYNVLHPIGWDSFGQPAEDAAIKRGVRPLDWTENNINQMRGQLKRLGFSYDWRREIFAHRPDYYKFDQWFFLKMYEKGLAYKKLTQVNWCETCKATLSNEQASGGLCWRCGNPVTKKDMQQWFLKITAYADQLLDDMKEIENGWPEKVLKRQRDWIGRSEGAYVDFALKENPAGIEKVRIFTTRIDTIYGANAIVVAAEHPVIESNFEYFSSEVKEVVRKILAEKRRVVDHEVEQEKEGIDTGLKAVNPFSGEELPVWVGNYVMMEYGTGAVMSVPAHDERDFDFAKKYGLPIRQVICRIEESTNFENAKSQLKEAFTDYGILVNSGDWSGKHSEQARKEMTEFAEKKGFGKAAVTYRLRDWGISRQRYWGAPIPIVYCDVCGIVPEKYENLPIKLPENVEITGMGESPLAKVPEFVNCSCPRCGKLSKRETDTMDTFVDSCWYYFRYCDPQNLNMPFDPKIVSYWTPVDQYIGGDDHAVMHLIYTRFWTKVMRDIGLVNFNEPVRKLLTQGMVVGETFFEVIPNPEDPQGKGKRIYYPPDSVKVQRDSKGKILSATSPEGKPLQWAIERMSKSKGNGVDPDEMIEAYGADATRLFILFAAPVENELVWNEAGIEGSVRFLQRLWRIFRKWKDKIAEAKTPSEQTFSQQAKALRRKTHQTIKRVTENLESLQFNTPIAALMELLNAIYDFKIEPENAKESDAFAMREALESLIIMLTPFAPHTAEELYSHLVGNQKGMLLNGVRFPDFELHLAKDEEIEIPIQINGKIRSKIKVSAEIKEEELKELALTDHKIKEYISNKEINRVIVVPKRLVNIVIKP
ncbi:MAG: leucine--tRNA ligase [Pyrinomonadaceae bacterium]|nr:leucine--tRNA ligase [Pyrinomonadaceae bacterium]MCX7639927.1 leucine--tRNA ligase [Pyrinomonadaceae bacterium]MDW8304099.1 leucine--tRNA ligase [Acidobacteriota bacterium]